MRRGRRRRALWAGATLAAVALLCVTCGDEPRRIATFNIRSFPASDEQVRGAFEQIDELDVDAIAVQEITEPARFEQAARQHLDQAWRFVWDRGPSRQHVGVLFDGAELTLVSQRTHDDTVVYRGAKPVLEVRLRGSDGRVMRLLVVHLKAGARSERTRNEQMRQLRRVIERGRDADERLVVAGDFNTVSPADRAELATLAAATELTWTTRELECTAYRGSHEACIGTSLDHVLTSGEPHDVWVDGPCDDAGCGRLDRCPAFWHEVSDHCPVAVDL